MNNLSELTTAIQDWSLPWFLEELDPKHYLRRPFLVFDLETTNREKGNPTNPMNRMVAASWYREGTGRVRYHRGDEYHQQVLLSAIEDILAEGGFLVGHNIKFDLMWMTRAGLDLHSVLCYDTMIGEFVLASGRPWTLGLDAVSKRYGRVGKGKYVDTLMQAGVCPSEMPHDYLQARAMRDVKDTLAVFLKQRKLLAEEGKLAVQYTRCLLTPVLAHIELQGIRLDRARVIEEHTKASEQLASILVEFNELTGGANPKSPQQMAKVIYGSPDDGGLGFKELTRRNGEPIRNAANKKFPLGVPKTDDKTLAKLKATNKRQRRFLELRKQVGSLRDALSKTLDFFKKVCEERDCLFFGQFNQTIAVTHRLTSSSRRVMFADGKERGAQLQNLPNAYKDLIAPLREGSRVGDHDGSQLEFRVAAFVGNDTKAKFNIRHDVDQHLFTASQMLRKGVEEVSKEERRKAKPDTFKPLYGGSRGTPEQERYYKAFREEFPDLAGTQKSWTFQVLETDWLRMPWGMSWQFPGTRMRDDGYIDNTPSIYNYPIQNLATGEIIPAAVVFLWHRLHRNKAKTVLFNTVHDSVVGDVVAGEEDLWLALGAQCFTLDVYRYLEEVYRLHFDLPLGVGSSISSRWAAGDGVEREINVEASGEWWNKGERA